jgi:hypothetical protein
MEQFDAAASRQKDLLIFKGWEIYEGELDTGMDLDAVRRIRAAVRGLTAMGCNSSTKV